MEKNTPKFTLNKNVLLGAAAVLVIAVLAAVLLWPTNIVSELTVEAGRESISANDFRREDKGIDAQFVSDMTAVDLKTIGSYPVKVQYKNKTHDCTVIVEDTVAPEAVVRNLAVFSYDLPDPQDFVVSVQDASPVTVAYEKRTDLTKDGSYLLALSLEDAAGNTARYEVVLTVFMDTSAPQLTGVEPVFTYIGTEPDYLAGITATDNWDMALQILVDSSTVDLNAVGTYDISYSVTDTAGNTTTIPSTVTITDDSIAPTIQGIHNISFYLGSTVNYHSGVVVTDDKDPSPKLDIDSSQVDTLTPGTYPLVYIARDMTGNETRAEVTVTVAEKPDTYVAEDIIYTKADELLKLIVTDGMTAEAKVKAIYAYVRSHYTYADQPDKTDWLQGAYVMMTEDQGDYFNYFAITKLLLERCDIPNIDVRRTHSASDNSDHCWSLVSIDGGATYYHVDATPRAGDGDDFCLITDADLDAYSDANNGSHNRDKSLYPATPQG